MIKRNYTFHVAGWAVWTFVALMAVGMIVLVNLANLAGRGTVTPRDVGIALVLGAVSWGLFALTAWATQGVEFKWSNDEDLKAVEPLLSNRNFFHRHDPPFVLISSSKK